jgi:hypothetical protein
VGVQNQLAAVADEQALGPALEFVDAGFFNLLKGTYLLWDKLWIEKSIHFVSVFIFPQLFKIYTV